MNYIDDTKKMGIAFLCSYPMAKYHGGVATITNTLTREFLRKGYHVIYIAVCSDNLKDTNSIYETSQYFIAFSNNIEDISNKVNQLLAKEEIGCVVNMAIESWIFEILASINSNVLKISTLERKPYESDGVERMILQRWYPNSLKGYLWKMLGIAIPLIPRLFSNYNNSLQYSKAIQASDYYVVLSEKYKDFILNHLKQCDKDKIVSIANPNTFSAPRNVEKEKKVLFCGRLENHSKNVSDLLKAWRIVETQIHDWSLEIIGEGGDAQQLKKLATKLQLKNVNFRGFVDNHKLYFETSSIICVTSMSEGWCTVLAEGMINKCVPVVYDTFQSAHDIIVHGENGFFIYENNYKNLSSILISLMSNGGLGVYGKKASLSISEYTPSNIVDKWVELINTGIKNKCLK